MIRPAMVFLHKLVGLSAGRRLGEMATGGTGPMLALPEAGRSGRRSAPGQLEDDTGDRLSVAGRARS